MFIALAYRLMGIGVKVLAAHHSVQQRDCDQQVSAAHRFRHGTGKPSTSGSEHGAACSGEPGTSVAGPGQHSEQVIDGAGFAPVT
jgi:hypothetical protein